MARKSSHSILALGQWMSKWSIDSSSSSQRKHLFARVIPLHLSWSRVSTLPQDASHAKTPILGGTIGFQMEREGKAMGGQCTNFVYMSLAEKSMERKVIC